MAIFSDVEIRLRADIARLQQDMDAARRTVGSGLERINTAVAKTIGTFAGGIAFATFIKNAIDATDKVSDLSQATGVAIKDIAGLQLAFMKGGLEAGAFETSMVKLSKEIADNNEGFKRLGIQTRDSAGGLRSNKDVLYEVADAFQNLEDGTQKTALAIQIFGKSGAALIPLLNEGAEGLRAMDEMAAKLGLTFDEKTVEAAGDFNDTLDFLGMASQGVARQVAAELLPTLQSISGAFLTLITDGNGVSKMAQGIIAVFKVLYTAGAGVAQVFSTLGKTIGAAVSQVVAVLQGDFKTAAGIGREWAADLGESWASTAKSISDVWTGAGGEVVAAMTATQRTGTKVADAAEKDAARQVNAYADLVLAIKTKIAETKAEAAGHAKLNDAEKMAIELTEKLAAGKLALAPAQEQVVRGLIEEYRTNLELIESHKRAAEGLANYNKMQKEVTDARATDIKKAQDEAEANEKLAATFGMTKGEIEGLELARLQEQLAQRASLGLTLDEIEHLETLIALKQRSAAAATTVAALEENKKLWESIDKTAHDTFVSIANGGKDAATRLKDTFKNVFFDWLYQMTIKKWIIQLSPESSGGAGGLQSLVSGLSSIFGGGGSSAGGASGMFGSAANLLSVGKNIYAGFSGGLMSSMGSIVSSLGQTFGSAYLTSFGAGMSLTPAAAAAAAGTAGASGTAAAGGLTAGASAGAYAIPIAGWIAAGMSLAKGLRAQGWDATNGSLNTGGQVFGSAILGFNSILKKIGLSDSAANIFSGQSTIAKVFGRKNPEVTAHGIEGTISAAGFTGQTFADILEKGGWFRSDKRTTQTAAIVGDQDKMLDTTITAMVSAVKEFGGVLGIETAAIDGYNKAIKLQLGSDEAKNQEAITQLFVGVGDELAALLIPSIGALTKEGETASTALQRLADSYAAVGAIFDAIGVDAKTAFGAVGVSSLEARTRLLELAGGVEALASQTQFFAANFLSEAERIAPVQKALTEQLAALGYSSLATADQYKQAVLDLANSGRLATEEGAKLYAGLLALGPAFKQVSDYTAQLAADAAANAAAAAEAQARAQEEAAAAAEAQARAQEEAAAEAFRVAQQRATLELQLFNLTHTAEEQLVHQRELELAATNALLVPLQQQIYAMQDQAKAAAAAATALEKAAASAKAARAQADAQRAEAQKSQAGIAQAYAEVQASIVRNQQKAMEDAAAAAKELGLAWADANKAIMAEVASIRGMADASGATGLAQAQGDFTIATARARAGDVEAAKQLPGLSRALLELVQQTATTDFELRRAQAQTAASLEQTLALTGGAPLPTGAAGFGAPVVPGAGVPTPLPAAQGISDTVAAQINALRQENQVFAAQFNNALFAIARNTGNSADLLDKFDTIGMPPERTDQ